MWRYFLFISGVSSFINPYPKIVSKRSTDWDLTISDYSPLILTPYIENNETETAKTLALVTGLTPNITSYSGFLTIDEECDSNIFFWFFPSENNWEEDPVSIWLNGGPGSSSLIGLFRENGPYTLTSNGTLILNEYSWNRNSSMIYIDNPVGTGFSYSSSECYLTTQEEVGEGILNVLQQFFKLFPELSQNPFFLTGESYAGKYIPATAHAIFTSDQEINFNFQGVAIGSGWIDPVNQLGYGHFLYQTGLIDHNILNEINSAEENITLQVEQGNYTYAYELMDCLLDRILNASGFGTLYNFLDENATEGGDIASFVDSDEVRRAIHVGNAEYDYEGSWAKYHLLYDDMKSVRPWFEEILQKGYRVLLYTGQFDIIVAYPLTLNFLQKLNWIGADDYNKATRDIWYVEDEIAGYAKTVGNFTEVLVRNAGHLCALDQPKWALDLYNKFIFNEPFSNF